MDYEQRVDQGDTDELTPTKLSKNQTAFNDSINEQCTEYAVAVSVLFIYYN